MRNKRLFTAAALTVALLLNGSAAFAADIDYTGPLDTMTGQPASSSGNGETAQDARIQISDHMFYDRTVRAYIYSVPGAALAEVEATVADGMVVNDPVRIEADKGVDLRIYRNGTLLENPNLANINEVGQYAVETKNLNDQYARLFSFTIVGAYTGLINSYSMPTGFQITNVEMKVRGEDGGWVEAPAQWDRNQVSLTTEGSYKIEYQCPRTGMTYKLQTVIDHTAPVLALENVVNGLADGPVSLADLENGCSIYVQLNGGAISYTQELTRSGDYVIILTDDAGNSTIYEFTILVYFDSNSWLFFGLLVAVLAGAGIYLHIERKRLRVR